MLSDLQRVMDPDDPCEVCGAQVRRSAAEKHQQWHDGLATTIELELMRRSRERGG